MLCVLRDIKHQCLTGNHARLSLMSSRHSSQAIGWHRPGWLWQSSSVLPCGIWSGDGSGCDLLPPGGGAAVVLLATTAVGVAASRRTERLLLAPGNRAAAGPAAASSRTKPRVTCHPRGS